MRASAWLSTPYAEDSRQTRAEYYAWVERTTGRKHEKLGRDVPPPGFEYLRELWVEIRGGASDGMNGVRVTWRDLVDYQAATGTKLGAFEVEAIMAMDAAFRAAHEEERNGGSCESDLEGNDGRGDDFY